MKAFSKSLFILLAIALAGCNDSDTSNELDVKFELRDSFSQVSDTFTQGENIEFYVVMKNNSDSVFEITTPTGQEFDFIVMSEERNEEWRQSEGLAFTQAVSTYEIPAGEEKSNSYFWDQSKSDGNGLSVGNYTAIASIKGVEDVEYNFTVQ
ncbi:BsuPI-related putative proteinase inhibitor [Oceanospirillum maris]|uniref:BsuPI-related putative proteinase inhibitor n=1 Tax=Oceanospirillum maris TaxID=64977 RepID=UPI0003FA1270|nr:BsuPI-related putative proteinase inhibitor [Oceanospirillum maris]